MLGLMEEHYQGMDAAAFGRDLEGKSHALLLIDGGQMVGFTTLVVHRCRVRSFDEPVMTVYSGDTIVRHESWGGTAFMRGWIEALRELGVFGAGSPAAWLLLAGGTRTYRFLPVMWRYYTPGLDGERPRLASLASELSAGLFGERFDPAKGIVRPDHRYSLRPRFREHARKLAADPYARFFERLNPGHRAGDELVCLTMLHEDNLSRAGRRLLGMPSS
jgi:hypothetical protein